uniref:Protein AHNAK2-like n=1 Tax=Cyanistes caeruleus TaxID=156563 RepID=A0A8C0V1W4_CYACU
MEVTLKTEVEAGASGFSVKGGGNEGIFIKKVLKESPASKIFSLREGDQLLSATIFFDNIKYEDALKILQYSEPYRVQFSLKRKIAVQEDLEHSTAQHKKERIVGKVDISLPSVDVTLPQASVDLQAPEATLSVEGEAKVPEKEATKTKDSKFKMPKFGMPSFGWSSSREAKGTVAAEVDVSLKEPEVTVPSAAAEADVTLPSAPDVDLKAPCAEGKLELEGTGLKGKLKMPKFDKPKFSVSSPKAELPAAEISVPSAEVDLPSATVTAAGEGPGLGVKADVPGAKTEGAGWKLEKPSLKMPKADIKAPKVDVSLPSVDVTLPQASVDLQAPEATLSVEGEAKVPEKEATKTKDGKFKMPKFGMPSFGWSSSREAKGTVAAEVDVSLKEPEVTVPSAAAEADVTLPSADIQAPGVEATVETVAVAAEGEKGRFKMPDVKMPSVKLPKVKGPQAQISLPKAEVSLPKGQEGEVTLQGPEAEASLEVAVPSVVFSKPTVKSPKLDADISLPQAELKATDADVSIAAPDIKLPSVQGSLELQAPDVDLKAPCAEGKLELEGTGLKGKLKMPKFDKPKFSVSSPKAELPAAEISVPSAEVDLPSATVTLEKPSLKMPKADIKAPKVDVSLPSVDVTLPQASVDLQAPEATLSVEGEAKVPEKEGTVAAEVDVSLKEPEVTVPSAVPVLDISLPDSDVQSPTSGVSLLSSACKEEEFGKSQSPVFRIPKISLSKSFKPPAQKQSGLDVSGDDITLTKYQSNLTESQSKVTVKIHKFRRPKFRIRSKGKASESDMASSVESEIIVLDAPTVDPNVLPMEVTLPKLEAEMHCPDLKCKAEQEVITEERGTEEKENKFKSSKFKLPSFRWSPKKEAVASSHVEEHLEGPTLYTLSGDMESELTFPAPENQYIHEEFDTTEKDGEKSKTKKSQFTMPKISFPKMKGQKVQVSLPVLETDVSGLKQEKEGVSVQKSEKGSSGEGAGLGIKVPEVTAPTLEFSKPEAKAAKMEMDISMPTGEVTVPACEEDELRRLKSVAASASLSTSDIKMIPEGSLEVKSPDISVERTSSEIAVGDVEIKAEGSEGKTKMSKFQMPKVGIKLSKGKGSQKDVGQSKSEASEADFHLTSAGISIPKTDSDIQDSDAAVKIKKEIKQDGDGEEKEGHFKMPKFKLPSFSWSPKKEASVKSDSGANLEDQKLAVMSSRIDTEVKGTATDDQGLYSLVP